MAITNLYSLLFGKEKIRDGDVISMSEHGRVGGVSTGQGFKYTSLVDVTSTNAHTGNKEIRVFSSGHTCAENSSSTPLGSNAAFTGDWQDTLDYSEIIVSISTDQNSATNGLVVNWSANGTTVNETDEFSILANRGKTF